MKKYNFVLLLVVFLPLAALADVVSMNDGQRIKGVVVEEYTDRIVLSTADGEKEILKQDLRRIIYDLEEQNLTSLGDQYLDQGRFGRAHYYYDKALEVNPDYERARAGLDYAGSNLQQRGRIFKLDRIKRRQEEARWQKGLKADQAPDMKEEIKRQVGIYFGDTEQPFLITDISRGSPAWSANFSPGDRVVSCWGRKVEYMPPEEVYETLLMPGVMEVKLAVTREVKLSLPEGPGNYASILGAEMDYDMMQGLMIESIADGGAAQRAGIDPGDLVLEIQGESTRYMPEKKVHDIIRSGAGETVSLKIERAGTIWKKFGGIS